MDNFGQWLIDTFLAITGLLIGRVWGKNDRVIARDRKVYEEL